MKGIIMEKLFRLCRSISFRLQVAAAFLSLVGLAFGIKSYLHVINTFGESQSSVFLNDIWVQVSIALAINLVIGLLIYNTITVPLRLLTKKMKILADGNFEEEVPYVSVGNEIGSIARRAKVFRENGLRMQQLEREQTVQKEAAEVEKKSMMKKLAHDFESSVHSIITAVSSSANNLCETANSMQQSVTDVSQRAETVATASEQTSSNVGNVSAAVEEMSVSIKGIASQVVQSTTLVKDTVEKTKEADETTKILKDAVAQITGILQMIQEIAGQINLLALNATIESARAGEAGKGFAVVASEVKNLASQTTKATEEISRHIESVQGASEKVVYSLQKIQDSINHVNQFTTEIAAAVEQQSAVTREISSNMQNASHGVQAITASIGQIKHGAGDADHSAKEVLGAAQLLSKESVSLREQVKIFIDRIAS
jgi:methyl-accepting chemotaxis protein